MIRAVPLLLALAACAEPCPSACDDLERLGVHVDEALPRCPATCRATSAPSGTADALADCLAVTDTKAGAIACFRAEERALLGAVEDP